MSARPWLFLAVAAGAATIGVWAGPNYAVAVPAALAAIGAGGLALATGIPSSARPATVRAGTPEVPVGGVRAWFTEGSLGREEIVLLLDRLDREGPHPALPARPPQELRLLVDLPARQFRQYVRARLDQIETGR